MKQHVLAALTLCWLGYAGAASGSQADNKAAPANSCQANNRIDLPNLNVQVCTSDSMEAPLRAGDSAYYGVLAMKVDGGGAITAPKKFGQALRALFGVKDDMTATISVSVSQEGVVLYERSLLLVKVAKDGSSEVSFNTTIDGGSDITPYFPLKDHGKLQVDLKVAQVTARDGGSAEALKSGINVLNDLGGGGWLLSSITEDAFLGAAAKAINVANKMASSRNETTIATPLSTNKRVRYAVTLRTGSGPAVQSIVEVYLRTKPSLITDAMLPAPYDYVPDVNVPGSSPDWAGSILVNRKPDTYLSTYLASTGVPTKLTALKVQDGPSGAIPRVEAVNTACEALRDALAGTPLRLSDSDRNLVLYSELKKGGVFSLYRPRDLRCLDGVRDDWISLYKLPMPGAVVYREIPFKHKTERLERVASHWFKPSPEERGQLLAEDDFTEPVRLTAAPDFLPNNPAPVSADPATGLATWDVDPRRLGLLRKSCFGNHKQTAASDRSQTGFAQFEGSVRSYLLTFQFKADEEWGRDGPIIEALTIRPATAADVQAYNNNSNCVDGVAIANQ